MRMKKTKQDVYECRLEPYHVQISRNHVRINRGVAGVRTEKIVWYPILRPVSGSYYEVSPTGYNTLTRAKAATVRLWLKLRMYALLQLVETEEGRQPELSTLYNAAVDATNFDRDLNAPAILLDWLEEHGYAEQVRDWIILPGRKAKVVWPKAWEVAVGSR